MRGQPITVYDAEFRLYTVDADGELLSQQWIGGTADEIELTGQFLARPFQYHGRARAQEYHEDESWGIVLGNVRAMDRQTLAPPRQSRNRELAIVIVWYAPDHRVWMKRCYTGVKEQPANVDKLNIRQALRYSAEEMFETAGSGTKPGFELIREGQVYYVNGAERILLYTYDPGAHLFTVAEAGFIPSKAEILGGTDEVTINIGGDEALFADADGVVVGEVFAIGGSFLEADAERLEFWVGSKRCASLSVEQLAAPNVIEADVAPGSGIEVFSPDWLFSFGESATYAPAFTERAVA